MVQFLKENKAISNVVFAVSIVVLLAIVVTLGVTGYYRISTLQTENDLLQSSLASLQSTYNQLQSTHNQLQSQLNSLQSSYNQLISNYQQLLARVPSDKGIQIDPVYFTTGYEPRDGVQNVTLRNLCSTDVHVISLKLYHDNTLQSSRAVLIAVPANSTTTINLSPFLQPTVWDDLNDVYILKIETLEGYNATSDPLPLLGT